MQGVFFSVIPDYSRSKLPQWNYHQGMEELADGDKSGIAAGSVG